MAKTVQFGGASYSAESLSGAAAAQFEKARRDEAPDHEVYSALRLAVSTQADLETTLKPDEARELLAQVVDALESEGS